MGNAEGIGRLRKDLTLRFNTLKRRFEWRQTSQLLYM